MSIYSLLPDLYLSILFTPLDELLYWISIHRIDKLKLWLRQLCCDRQRLSSTDNNNDSLEWESK